MKLHVAFAAICLSLLVRSCSALTEQEGNIVAEGPDLFAMAAAFPRLQNFSGESYKIRLHYFTCRESDMIDLSSQQPNSTEVQRRGPQVRHRPTLVLHKRRSGAHSRVSHAVQITQILFTPIFEA